MDKWVSELWTGMMCFQIELSFDIPTDEHTNIKFAELLNSKYVV
jgi:hypothetical protein